MRVIEIISEASGKPKRANFEMKLLDYYKDRARKSQTRLARVEQTKMGRFGTKLKWLFRAVGITTSIVELYGTLEEIDDDYVKQTPLPRKDGSAVPMSEEQYNQLRELAFGTFQVQVIVPIVATWAIRLAKSVLFLNYVKRLAAMISAPVTGGLSIAAMLGTEAGIAAFQTWLGSKAGQDWLINSIFMEPIRTFGKVGDSAAQGLHLLFSGKTSLDKAKEKRDTVDPGWRERQGQAAQPGPAAPPPPSDYQDDSIRFVKGNTVYVGGVPVTDKDGFLDLRALDNMGVMSARAEARDRGQKDPLSGIPQRPGQTPIKLNEPGQPQAQGDKRFDTNKDAQAAWAKRQGM